MIATSVVLLSLLGLSLNLAFSSSLTQPDWAMALLLAGILAKRHNWIWVLPGIFIHDIVLHWSVGISFAVIALIPLAMIYFDQHLGSGLPQRVALMVIAILSLLQPGWEMAAVLLTLCLCVPIWYLLTSLYAQKPA
ncbi:hypothetical protein Ga0123462_0071 [Mariprofundus ferrinatatus]|uniref:Rod shape-determining protein MreD n=1 Tax=Mariprofundus ferrinatatus TaxID=1921087 RepID=A0A2K8L0W6_9PROT|nr:hypothetical protein [Mariprofundus ferrinatatus]ATX80950.1 hypothetical protein Ga0123462_0071 [Mariprofundus ferrinatatus]